MTSARPRIIVVGSATFNNTEHYEYFFEIEECSDTKRWGITKGKSKRNAYVVVDLLSFALFSLTAQ